MRRPHPRWLRAVVMTLAASSFLALPAQAENQWEDAGAQTFDAILLRPLGSIGTVVGFGLFLPAALFSSPGGRDSVSQAWSLFVTEPVDTTFRRKLGEF